MPHLEVVTEVAQLPALALDGDIVHVFDDEGRKAFIEANDVVFGFSGLSIDEVCGDCLLSIR